MEIHVRRAQPKDAPKINELLTQVCTVHHNGRPDIFKKGARKYTDGQLAILMEDETRPIFVGVDGEDAVVGYGFCMISEYRGHNIMQDRKELYIDDLCVDETARGTGVGSVIFEHIKKYAKEIGCYNVTLNVWACNPGAMAFYENKGMQMLKKEMEIIL